MKKWNVFLRDYHYDRITAQYASRLLVKLQYLLTMITSCISKFYFDFEFLVPKFELKY